MTSFTSFHEQKLLVTDISGTLVGGHQKGIEKLNRRLSDERDNYVLVYSSGRSLLEVVEDIENHSLLIPDYITSSDGTEIHRMPGEHPVDEWYQYIQLGFKRNEVVDHVSKNFSDLELQDEKYQTPLKISYMIEKAKSDELKNIRQSLFDAGLQVKLVYSGDLYLDLIPERAGSGPAIKFLVDSLVINPNQVFVSGSSGNDIGLFQYGFRGIVVANASRELKAAVELRAYFSHNEYAEGVLEGLEHYRFFKPLSHRRPRDLSAEALERAVDTLRRNVTRLGFSAASVTDNVLASEESNYFAVWSRDGIKTGLWSLSINDPELTDCFQRTLELMAIHQTRTGQIPAYVHILTEKPDYGGIGNIASIDSVLWFVIGTCRFAAYTGNRPFLEKLFPNLELAMSWLHAHDSNNCGLIEIPESSDWMDLFPRSYNVLYDEVLWYLACRDFSVICSVLGVEEESEVYSQIADIVHKKIQRQFWPTAKRLSDARESFSETQFTIGNAHYLLSQISPFGFNWRCDIYANIMAGLVGLLDETQMVQVFQFLWGVGSNSPYPIKCLYPAIYSGASDWKDYFVTNFLNLPNHYHNGGIWPFIGGLWVRFLAKLGREELAISELNSLAEACKLGVYGEWEFNEWLHGETGRPMGKAHQAWSAAGFVAAWKALYQDTVPADFEPLTEEMFG
jgi:sucrose-6-phosphatase